MAVKKSAGNKAAKGVAVDAALKLLANEHVRARLIAAPEAVIKWAIEWKQEHGPGPASDTIRRLNPASRLGQRGLEKRAASVRRAIAAAFPLPSDEIRTQLELALNDVDKGLVVAGNLPLLKRKVAHHRVDGSLDALERGLVEAVLPRKVEANDARRS